MFPERFSGVWVWLFLRCHCICEEMMDVCISPDLQATQGIGGDNMTVVLVLLNGQDHGCATPCCPSSHPVVILMIIAVGKCLFCDVSDI